MAEAVAGHVIVAHLDHQFGLERLPLSGALGRPAARAARGLAGEARSRLSGLRAAAVSAARSRSAKPDVNPTWSSRPVLIVEAEQQRADLAAVRAVAEAADHAIGAAQPLDLQHGPLAGLVSAVEPLGHHAVEGAARCVEPALRCVAVARVGRQAQRGTVQGGAPGRSAPAPPAARAAARPSGLAPPGATSRSNRMKIAGVSADSLRTRLSAGCSRICKASNDRVPSTGMASSPSSTKSSAGQRPDQGHDLRENSGRAACPIWRAVRHRRPIGTPGSGSRPIWARTASPGSSGSASTSRASMGSMEPAAAGRTWSGPGFLPCPAMACLLTHEPPEPRPGSHDPGASSSGFRLLPGLRLRQLLADC